MHTCVWHLDPSSLAERRAAVRQAPLKQSWAPNLVLICLRSPSWSSAFGFPVLFLVVIMQYNHTSWVSALHIDISSIWCHIGLMAFKKKPDKIQDYFTRGWTRLLQMATQLKTKFWHYCNDCEDLPCECVVLNYKRYSRQAQDQEKDSNTGNFNICKEMYRIWECCCH